MPKNWNKTVSIQEAKAAYAVGDDLDAYCFLYEGDRVRHVKRTVSGDIVTLPPYVPPATLYTKTGRFIDSLIADIVPVQSGSGDPSPDNVRPISGWSECNITISPSLDAEDGTTYPVTFPSEAGTVYGGTLDATTGVLTVDRAGIIIDGVNHYFSSNSSGYWHITPSIPYPAHIPYAQNDIKSSFTARSNQWGVTNNGNSIFTRESSWTGVFDSVDAINAFCQGAAQTVIYKLAESQTYQLTPTEIILLPGENNIFADTGPINLTYIETQEV